MSTALLTALKAFLTALLTALVGSGCAAVPVFNF